MKEINEESKTLLLNMLEAARNYPFVCEGWSTKTPGRDEIEYVVCSDPTGYYKFFKRLKRGLGWVFRSPEFSFHTRLEMAHYELSRKVRRDIPDAAINDGSIICYWDEAADYIAAIPPADLEMVLEDVADALGILPPDFKRHFTLPYNCACHHSPEKSGK